MHAYDEITDKLRKAFNTPYIRWELRQEPNFVSHFSSNGLNMTSYHPRSYNTILNVSMRYFATLPEWVAKRMHSHFSDCRYGRLTKLNASMHPMIGHEENEYHLEFTIVDDFNSFIEELAYGARDAFDREFHRLLEDELCS